MTARRLPAPIHPGARRGRPATIVVDGQPVSAFEGEPVAVAMLAAGQLVLSRSFRLHRPRGLMCSTGQCGWCECRIDGRPSVRSCRAVVADRLVVEGEHAWPSVPRDVLGALELGSRWIPPTFYHHRFLRPRRLRKRYLDVIRWFGGRGRLALPPGARDLDTGPRRPRVVDVDIAVVGGGPAGLLAARSAAESGASVVVLEAEAEAGGPWRWRDDDIPGSASLDALLAALRATGRVEIETGTTALSLDDGGLHAVGPATVLDVRCHAVIVATGSHERVPLVVGNDRPGVMGARTVEWLIRRHGVSPGTRAVLVGAGPDLDRAADAILAAGGDVARRIATEDLVSIVGRTAVSGARVRAGDGSVTTVAADLLVVGDRVPAAEFAVAARASGGSVTVVLAGAAAGHPIVTPESAAAAAEIGRTVLKAGVHEAAADAGPAAVPVAVRSARAMVCFCEDVCVADLRHEVAVGYRDPELVKRRTGALTGPCQGKYCATGFRAVLPVDAGQAPTTRPPARPVRLGDLVVGSEAPGAESRP